MKYKFLATALVFFLLATPMSAFSNSHQIAKETDDLAMIWDLLIIRPIAIGAMVAGAILYVPAALVTSAGENDMNPIKKTFLKAPYQFAIERPLGHLAD